MLYQIWCSMQMPPPMPMVIDPPPFATPYLRNNEPLLPPSLLSIEYENPAAAGQSSPNHSYHSQDEISSVDGEAPDSPSRRLSSTSSEDGVEDMDASSSSKSSSSSSSEGAQKAAVPHWLRHKPAKPFENMKYVAKVVQPSQQLQPEDFPALESSQQEETKKQEHGGKKCQKQKIVEVKKEQQPLWHLGGLMEGLLNGDVPQPPAWEDAHLELTSTMDTIERLLRNVFKKTAVLALVSPSELPCRRSLHSSFAFFDQDEQQLYNRQLADFEYQRERNESICRVMMTIEEQVARCNNYELQQVIDREFTRVDLALRLISTILHDSPLSEEASRRDSDRAFRLREQMEIDSIRQAVADATRSGPVRRLTWNEQVKVVNKPEGLLFPPSPMPEIEWREDPQRLEEIRMNPAIHFVPITEQIEEIETEAHSEHHQSGSDSGSDSGIFPHFPQQPINEEIVQINSLSLLVDTCDSNDREDSECSTSRESSPLSYEEQVKLRFRADVSALAGVSRESPTRRVPSPPQVPVATTGSLPPGVSLVLNFQQERQRSYDRSVETFERFLTRAPTVPAVEEDKVQSRADKLLELLQKRKEREEKERAKREEEEKMRRYEGQPIVRMNSFELEQWNAERLRKKEEAERPMREAEKEAAEKKRRFDEMVAEVNRRKEAADVQAILDRRAAEQREKMIKEEKARIEELDRLRIARAVLEEEMKKKQEEDQRRLDAIAAENARREELKRQRDEAERLRREEEARVAEAEERERVRKEQEDQAAEEERIERERLENERLRLMAREDRKALERKQKEEDDQRKAEEEEKKKREAEAKREELERSKLQEAATLEEKKKEADRLEAARRQQQRDEDKQKRTEEQRKAAEAAQKRQKEQEEWQALSPEEKLRQQVEENKKKREELESVVQVEPLQAPSSPPKKITNSRKRGRKSQPNSRLQSTDSFDQPSNTRDHSRETNTSGGSGESRETNESNGAKSEEFQKALKKATKKKGEDGKFKPIIHVEAKPELNDEDKKALDKAKALAKANEKDARRSEQLEKETKEKEVKDKETKEATDSPKNQGSQHANKNRKKEKPPKGLSAEFLRMREENNQSNRFWSCVNDAWGLIYQYLAIIALIVGGLCLIFGTAWILPASTTESQGHPRIQLQEPEKVAVKPNVPEKPPPTKTKQSPATSSDDTAMATINELKCLFWAFKPPSGAAFCVRQPILYHLAEYHDSTIVELADQEERNPDNHATVYDTCEYQTGLHFSHNIHGENRYWFQFEWVDVNKTEYNEIDAAVAYDMLISDKIESCYSMFCHQPVGLVKNESYRELLYVLCNDFTRVLARLAHIVYAGWGEEVLMRTHSGAIPKPWFTLEYPYKSVNLDARNKYALVKYEGDDEYDLDIMRRTDVPLPLNPRRFSEKREHYFIESLFRNRSDPDTDWIVYKGVKVETVRFDDDKARQWAEVRDKYVKVKVDGSSFVDSNYDEVDCAAILPLEY